jgi:hypothetical protein
MNNLIHYLKPIEYPRPVWLGLGGFTDSLENLCFTTKNEYYEKTGYFMC